MRKLTTRGHAVAEAIAAREPFKTHGALRGDTWTVGSPLGILPDYWRARLAADLGTDGRVYMVWSYQTPIAWYTEAGWVVPDAKYSVTTSHHQGRLYLATPRVA